MASNLSRTHPPSAGACFAGQDLAAYVGKLGEREDVSGRAWSFAVATIDRHDLIVAFAQPTDELFRWTTFHVAVSFVLPVFMVIFTIVAIWLATDRMVLQWLLYLRRVTAVYAQGHYGFRPSRMDQAPSEFRVLGHAIEDMALAIRERDARLREGLAEKTALVREIHHRVKNSLQVVVSLLSLYGSSVKGEEDGAGSSSFASGSMPSPSSTGFCTNPRMVRRCAPANCCANWRPFWKAPLTAPSSSPSRRTMWWCRPISLCLWR